MADQEGHWFWGKCETTSKFVIMKGKGGYKCRYCDKKLSERFDCIALHLKTCKAKPVDFTREILKGIPKLKMSCQYCLQALDLTGVKKERHLKVCKGE